MTESHITCFVVEGAGTFFFHEEAESFAVFHIIQLNNLASMEVHAHVVHNTDVGDYSAHSRYLQKVAFCNIT